MLIVNVTLSIFFVSPDVPLLDDGLSLPNPLVLLASDATASFFSAFDFRNAVKGEDDSVFSGLLALLSCLLRHDDPDVGFKSNTEKWGRNGKEEEDVDDVEPYREVDRRREGEG